MLALFSVLWHPQKSLSSLQEIKVIWLVAIVISIELLYSLSSLQIFAEAASKAVAANPALPAGAFPYLIGVGVLVSAVSQVFWVALVAVLFLLVAIILGGRTSFRSMIGMLLLASAPALVDHILRATFFHAGWSANVTSSVLVLSRILPDLNSPLLASVLKTFDLFDLWTAVLVALGFVKVSGLSRVPALGAAILVWGLLQLLLYRLHTLGAQQ